MRRKKILAKNTMFLQNTLILQKGAVLVFDRFSPKKNCGRGQDNDRDSLGSGIRLVRKR